MAARLSALRASRTLPPGFFIVVVYCDELKWLLFLRKEIVAFLVAREVKFFADNLRLSELQFKEVDSPCPDFPCIETVLFATTIPNFSHPDFL
jgi:hypothetical protein